MLRPKLVRCSLGSGADQVELFDRNDGNDSIAGLTGMSAIHNRRRYRFDFVCPRKDVELDLVDHPIPRVEVAILSIASDLGNVDALDPARYADRTVFIVGKRNSGFELAQGLLPWTRSIYLASPRPIQTDALALSPLRVRYLHPYDEYARGGPGTYVLDVSIERIDRYDDGFRIVAHGTTWDGRLVLDADDVIAATGFQTPLRDLPALGLVTVSDGRVPALTPFWESVSLSGVYGGFLNMVPLGAAFQKGVTIRMGQCNVLNYMDELMKTIEEGKIDPSFVITHRCGLEEGPKMYETFKKKQDGCIKVVMNPHSHS